MDEGRSLAGYGGFEMPMLAYYSATDGYAWLENRGAIVLANIRGGIRSDVAPDAMKENRQKVYDDFIAVLEDLILTKFTSSEHLGIGQRRAKVPLLNKRRYSKFLAGASWMDGYGHPDNPAEWAYIQK